MSFDLILTHNPLPSQWIHADLCFTEADFGPFRVCIRGGDCESIDGNDIDSLTDSSLRSGWKLWRGASAVMCTFMWVILILAAVALKYEPLFKIPSVHRVMLGLILLFSILTLAGVGRVGRYYRDNACESRTGGAGTTSTILALIASVCVMIASFVNFRAN